VGWPWPCRDSTVPAESGFTHASARMAGVAAVAVVAAGFVGAEDLGQAIDDGLAGITSIPGGSTLYHTLSPIEQWVEGQIS
jgi:hypothetical protein